MHPLIAAVKDWNAKKQLLLDSYPELADDLETLNDTTEGETNLSEIILWVVRKADADKRMVEAAKAEMAEIKARADRLFARANRWRTMAEEAMAEAGLKKVQDHRFTVTMSAGKPSVIITDDKMVPRQYGESKWYPSKTMIKEALEKGTTVPGATFSNAKPTLTVRNK